MGTCPSIPLIGLTIHGSTGVPVFTPRVPRLEGEDTVCIILAHESANEPTTSSGEETVLNGEYYALSRDKGVDWAAIRQLDYGRVDREVGSKVWVDKRDFVCRRAGCGPWLGECFCFVCVCDIFGTAPPAWSVFTASPVATSYQLTLFSL